MFFFALGYNALLPSLLPDTPSSPQWWTNHAWIMTGLVGKGLGPRNTRSSKWKCRNLSQRNLGRSLWSAFLQICRLSCKSTQFPCWPPTVSGCCHPASRDNVWTDKLLGAARDGIHCFPCDVWWCVFVHKTGCTKHGLPRVHRGIWKIQNPPYCNWEGEYMKPYTLSLIELALHLPQFSSLLLPSHFSYFLPSGHCRTATESSPHFVRHYLHPSHVYNQRWQRLEVM